MNVTGAHEWKIWFRVCENDHLVVLEAIAQSAFMEENARSLLSGRLDTLINTSVSVDEIETDANRKIVAELDESQLRAVKNASVIDTGDRLFSLVQGSAGTGRSSVVTNIISVWLMEKQTGLQLSFVELEGKGHRLDYSKSTTGLDHKFSS